MVDVHTVTIARYRQEDAVAVGAGNSVTVYAIKFSPLPSTLVVQFLLLFSRWHAPTTSPFYVGNIVLGLKNSLVVNSAITAACTILGHVIIIAFTPFVGAPIVVFFFLGLTPGVVTAMLLGLCCAYIAGCPLDTTGQAKIDIFVTVVRVILAISTRNQKTMTAL